MWCVLFEKISIIYKDCHEEINHLRPKARQLVLEAEGFKINKLFSTTMYATVIFKAGVKGVLSLIKGLLNALVIGEIIGKSDWKL